MDLEIVIDCHTEWSQREKNIIWYRLYVEYEKMAQMNLFTKQKQSNRYRIKTYSHQGEKRG